jgi:hypothetical protein
METPMKTHLKIVWATMMVIAALSSAGCYVTQDANGQWWACEDYEAAHGTVTGCTPTEPPFGLR